MNSLHFGLANAIKGYCSKSPYQSISKFGSSGECTCNEDGVDSFAVTISRLFILILIVGGIFLGFMAVPYLCPDRTERGKNVRLGLYAFLILSGGQIGWILAILWLCKVNICL